MKPVDPAGRTLDADFDVEVTEGGADVVLHARYGGRNSERKSNVDYFPALELLLLRLASIRAVIENVSVDSRVALRLPSDQRSLDLDFPIRLLPAVDAAALRVDLTRAQRGVARDPDAGPTGGNNHKRIRISVDLSSTGHDPTELSDLLVGRPTSRTTNSGLGAAYREARADPTVAPADVFTFDPATREQALAGHARVQNELARYLDARGVEPRSPKPDEPDFDLAWVYGAYFVAEVKSLSGGNEDRQLRLGVGQVLHYRHLLAQRYGTTYAVVAVESEPGEEWSHLCDEVGITLTWPPNWPGLSQRLGSAD